MNLNVHVSESSLGLKIILLTLKFGGEPSVKMSRCYSVAFASLLDILKEKISDLEFRYKFLFRFYSDPVF